MISTLALRVLLAGRALADGLIERAKARRPDEAGSTLEKVILVVGGMTLALLAYGVIRAAVESRLAPLR